MTEFLTIKEAAKLLKISEKFLKKLNELKTGPPYIKLGPNVVRYPKDEFDKWIKKEIIK